MDSNETTPIKKDTPMTTTSDKTIKIEDLGNGLFIKWTVTTH
jgi:hypothetical protein